MARQSQTKAPPARASADNTPAKLEKAAPAREHRHHWARQLGDELFFVFAIVMFFKLFLVDLYKIPSGSMTPTLIGGLISTKLDLNQNGLRDLVYWLEDYGDHQTFQFFGQPNGKFVPPMPPSADVAPQGDPRRLSFAESRDLRVVCKPSTQYDRILVNKLSYWFDPPHRGEIVVFKVPASIWEARAPIYIKRLAGEPRDVLTFDPHGRLIANGVLAESPDFFKTMYYSTRIKLVQRGARIFPENNYLPVRGNSDERILTQIRVPEGEAYVFGDNTLGSFDSRFWGGVPIDNFKGRAFFRMWPLTGFGFLE